MSNEPPPARDVRDLEVPRPPRVIALELLPEVRRLAQACPSIAGPFRGEWDGTDGQGREVPSGIYFLRYAGANGLVVKRIALTR